MRLHIKRALSDTRSNAFLSMITVMTMALSLLVLASFVLFVENGGRIAASWIDDIAIIAFLSPETDSGDATALKASVTEILNGASVRFISRDQALERLKNDMGPAQTFLEGLEVNPLPHSLEITLGQGFETWEAIETAAGKILALDPVTDVEYGQEWRRRFFNLLRLFRLTGYAMAGLFCFAALLITVNTVRLSVYTRRDELDTMRLVGATDRFIRLPIYISGIVQGTLGGILGVLLLFVIYLVISSGLMDSIPNYALFDIRFISWRYCIGIIGFGSILGFLGCHLSLKHYLK